MTECSQHNQLLHKKFEQNRKHCPDVASCETLINNNGDLEDNSEKNDEETNRSNKLTLNEALQSISLAYSPVTKQLHLVDNADNVNLKDKKFGHRRIQDGSFSSTISTTSEPSTSGSLLSDDRSLSNYDLDDKCDSTTTQSSKGIKQFFSKWTTSSDGQLWKLFHKTNSTTTTPTPPVASSSALIQLKRPATLPAKTEEEEQKHQQQYNEILAAVKKKEAKNSAAKEKRKKEQLRMEEQQTVAAKHFQIVIKSWTEMENHKKTQELWWQGLPSSVRGKIWRLAIGNELNITSQLYEICLGRAQTRLSNRPDHPDEESSMDAIELDISRTFPHLGIFQHGGPYSDILHSLLASYVCFRPDVGYVQGMSYIAAILILNMEALDAFICFANLLNQPLHLSAFTLNQTEMTAYYAAYNRIFNNQLPKLFGHFERAGLTPDLYLLDWIYTIFAKAMPLDVACRIWDVFLRDGYEFVFRTALGILHLYQTVLEQMDFLHGAQFLIKLPEDISSDRLFKSINSISTSIGKTSFSCLVGQCNL